jgi:hypothetical protein
MAEIKQFLSPEVVKQQDDYLKKLEAIKNEYFATAKASAELWKNIDKINVTSKNTTTVQKKLGKATSEAANIQRQYNKVKEKSRIAEGNYSKALIKVRHELNNKNKATKRDILISKAQEGSYNKLNVQLLKNIDRWKSLGEAQRKSKEGKQLLNTIKGEIRGLKNLDKQIGRSQRHVGDYGRALKGVAGNLLGAFGVVGGVAMFARVMRDAFGTLRSFTKENAVLAGVLGKTREEVEELTEQSIQLGSIYPVTASEVTKLQVSFARLGFTIAEIQNLTEATIQGSIALNAGLDETATLVGAVVKAYSDLGTADAGKIIDQLTLSTQRSSLSFSSLETALPKVAGAANALGESLSGTLSKLAIAQDATLDASVAGTSLRNIYLELSNKGLTYNEAMDMIRNSTGKLSTAFDLFGKRGAIVALALADNQEKAEELRGEFDSTGDVAERVAQEQMETLDGAIKSLDSSWEKFILGLRDSEGFLSTFVQSAASTLDILSDEYASFAEKISLLILGSQATTAKALQTGRKGILDSIKTANEDELNEIIDANRAKVDEGDKFAKKVVRLAKNRIVAIAKEEDDARKREKTNIRNAQLRILEIIDTGSEKAIERTLEKNKKLLENEEFAASVKLALEKRTAKGTREEREKAEKEANKAIEAERKRHYQAMRKANEEFVEDAKKDQRLRVHEQIKAEQERLDSQNTLEVGNLKRRAKNREENLKDEKAELASAEETKQVIRNTAFEAASMLNDAITERRINNLQREFDVLEMQKEAELSKENLTAKERQKIEERYAKQAAILKTKQAKAEKRGAIFSAIINTIKAVIELGIVKPQAIAAGVLGGILTAKLIAEPLPKFAKGTKAAPKQGVFGEEDPELMRTVAGKYYYASSATMFSGDEFKGAEIWDGKETSQIMSNLGSGILKGRNIDQLINITLGKQYERGFDKVVNELRTGNNKLAKAMKTRPILVQNNNRRGYDRDNYLKHILN